MTELILHIGTPKTGSTTIQRFLEGNLDELARRGVGMAEPPAKRRLLGYGWRETETPPRFEVPPGCRKYIISYEKLFSQSQSDAVLERLSRALTAQFHPIKIVCMLRRQDEVSISAHNTHVITGGTRPFNPRKTRPWYDYVDSLGRWEKHFPGAEMLVSPTAPGEKDVLEAFLEFAGIDPSGMEPPKIENASLPATALDTLRVVNRFVEDEELRRKIAKAVRKADLVGPRAGLPAKKRAALVAPYEETNDAVARRYLGRKRLFTHPFPDDKQIMKTR